MKIDDMLWFDAGVLVQLCGSIILSRLVVLAWERRQRRRQEMPE